MTGDTDFAGPPDCTYFTEKMKNAKSQKNRNFIDNCLHRLFKF